MKTARSLVLAVAGAALVLAPIAAQASALRQLDARGDLQYVTLGEDDNPTDVPPQVSTNTNGDVVATKITYAGTSVRITERFAGLARTGTFQHHFFEVHGGKYVRTILVEAASGYWAGRSFVLDGGGNLVRPTVCKPTVTINYDTDIVTAILPAKCVKTPASVKVGVGTQYRVGDKLYYDDALATKGALEDDLVLSDPISRS